MSNVVNFLECLGRDVDLREADKSALLRTMIDAEIAPQVRVAILAGDRVALETLLASRSITCCGVFPGKEEEDESEEEPSKDDEEIVGLDRIRSVA